MPKPGAHNPRLAIITQKTRRIPTSRSTSELRAHIFHYPLAKIGSFFRLSKFFGRKICFFIFLYYLCTAFFPNRCNPAICPDGGIGRRVGLKHQCRKASRFDPGSGYELSSKEIAKPLIPKGLAIFSFLKFP